MIAAPRPPTPPGMQDDPARQALAVEVEAVFRLALGLLGIEEARGHRRQLAKSDAEAAVLEAHERLHHAVRGVERRRRVAVGHSHHPHPRGDAPRRFREPSPRRPGIPGRRPGANAPSCCAAVEVGRGIGLGPRDVVGAHDGGERLAQAARGEDLARSPRGARPRRCPAAPRRPARRTSSRTPGKKVTFASTSAKQLTFRLAMRSIWSASAAPPWSSRTRRMAPRSSKARYLA